MNVNSEFFLEFMKPLLGGVWDFIKAIGNALVRIFNLANYFDIVNKYNSEGRGVSVFVVILAWFLLLCLLK